jgi:hypothetical protein
MKGRRIVCAFFVCFGGSLAIAQESIRLQFEVVKNGATVARPEVSVASGAAGSIEVDGVGRFAFTPTLSGSHAVAIGFDISSGGKQLQPRLVISGDEPGSLSWTSDTRAQSFKLTVSWMR